MFMVVEGDYKSECHGFERTRVDALCPLKMLFVWALDDTNNDNNRAQNAQPKCDLFTFFKNILHTTFQVMLYVIPF